METARVSHETQKFILKPRLTVVRLEFGVNGELGQLKHVSADAL